MKKLKKFLSAALALSLVVTQFPGEGSVASAAKKPTLNKTKLTITAGKKATLKVKNKIKGSTYTWKSSKTKVATVTKTGVVKGVKAGNATITCKVKTKADKKAKAKVYTLKCKVTVKKKTAVKVTASPDIEPTTVPTTEPTVTPTTEPTTEPTAEPTVTPTTKPTIAPTVAPTANPEVLTVKTQEALETALKAKETRSLTLETDAAETYIIPEGEYKDIELIVNAPNADIENSGVFKSITINAIKDSTWTEKAQGNVFMILAVVAHINVIKEAIIKKIIFLKSETQVNAALTVNEGGIVESVIVQTGVKLAIDGSTTTSVPVAVESAGEKTEITSAVPVAVETATGVKVTLEKGAENSTVKTTTNVPVEIQNNTTTSVNVIKSNGTTQTVSSGTGTTILNTNSGYHPGSSVVKPSTPTPTPVPEEPSTPDEDSTIILYESEEGSEEAVTITADELRALLGDTTSVKSCTIHIDTIPNNDYGGLGFIKAYILNTWSNIVTGTAGWGDDNVADNALAEGNEYVLSSDQLTSLLNEGFEIYPVDSKIAKVTITPDKSTSEKPSIPEEPSTPEMDIADLAIESDWTAGWNSVKAVNESAFSNYTVDWLTGKRITITYTIDEWTQLGVFAGNNEYSGGYEIREKSNVDSSFFSFDITEEIAEKLLSGGLYIMANQATIDSISIGIGLNIETDWTAGWNSVKAVNESIFSNYTVDWLTGKRITIAYTIDEWTQLGVFAGNNEYSGGYEIREKSNVDSSLFSFDITEEIAEKLISGGLYVMANQATLNSINIVPSPGN